MENIVIRNATVEDAQALLDIYSYYVKNTAISFEYEVPSLEEFRDRIRNTLKKYPYLCILKDGIIKGYTYAGAFVGRAAYDWSAEMTVYIAHDARKCGLGRRIYEALEASLKEMGILNVLVIRTRRISILRKTAHSFISIWDTKQSANFITADINLIVGII